ncbi:MAG TPA: serine protease, partial [Flavisolibacter sp.]|nr:serine protease [Flavisolibacter sp.]
LQQMNSYDQTKAFKSLLNETHTHLAEAGAISSPKMKGKAKLVYLFNRYKRTAAIAASIAGLTALTMSAFIWSLSPAKEANADLIKLDREINAIKTQNNQQNREINIIKQNIGTPSINYTTGGTGFLIDAKGLVVTNAHVIQKARNIVVQNSEGKDLKVKLVYNDVARDVAILKIEDTAFKAPTALPYSIKKSTPEIAETVYTLGFPRNDMVYGEGYLAAKTGFNGDTLTCQIAIAANPGNSGGPVLNRNGEVIGILSAKQTSAEGAVFATQSKYIHQALAALQQDTAFKKAKLPSASAIKGLDRTQQVKKITEFIYMVKVN